MTGNRNEFSKNAMEQAAAAGRIRTSSYLPYRLDLRGKTIFAFTEKPGMAEECAYSLYRNSNGWQLGIHVVDVCEYVCEGSPLDLEARERCCTVSGCGDFDRKMLPDNIIELCNLANPGDKLAISVIFDLDEDYNVISGTCEESVIRISTTCVYSEIDQLQTAGDTSSVMLLREKYAPFREVINNMYELAAVFCMRRMNRGGLDCTNFRKVYEKDSTGRIIAFRRESEPDSRAMLREIGYFVAEEVGKIFLEQKMPCVFNGRGTVNEQTLNLLSDLLNLDTKDVDPNVRAAIIADKAKGTEYYSFVCSALAASVPAAEYSAEPINNFFCACDTVVSFFHPVSHYADLLIQRVSRAVIKAKDPKNLNLNRHAKLIAEVTESATAAAKEISKISRDYNAHQAFEYISENSGLEFVGFPAHLNDDGSILVLLECGILVNVPSDIAQSQDFPIAKPMKFSIIEISEEDRNIFVRPSQQ